MRGTFTMLWRSLLVAVVLAYVVPSAYAEDLSVSEWLKKANTALTSYDYHAALDAYDHAIELDPSAYLTYFRRATAQQALGRSGLATKDLKATLERNPTFAKAYLQLARIDLKEGEYAAALETLQKMKKMGATQAQTDSEQWSELQKQVTHAQTLSKKLSKSGGKKAEECVQVADELLKLAPNDIVTRKLRAECELERGHLDAAVTDWTRLAHLAPSPELQLRLSLLAYYVLGTRDSQMQEAGLTHLKACLHNDPDNKACIRAHKQLRKMDKQLQKARKFSDSQSWNAVISALKGAKVGGPTLYEEVESILHDAVAANVLPSQLAHVVERSELRHEIEEMYCRSYVEQNLIKKGMPWCDKLLARDPNHVQALVAKGEEQMSLEKYEEAVRIFTQAFEKTQNSDRKIHARLSKAQKLLKQSKSKDYYKILGVARDADERTIKKAYRRLAREHHPDKGGSQEKMAEINEAFGVLGDAELRARYDQGDDPNDPMAGQEQAYAQAFTQGGHPFAQFFQQAHFGGGGGGQQFHFSF